MHTRLKKLRMDNNWSAAELAEKLFIDKSSISKWENGKAQPSLDVIKQYSELFNRSIDWIVSGKTDAKNERVKPSKKNNVSNDKELKEIKELLKQKNDLSSKSFEEISKLKEMINIKTTKRKALVRESFGNADVKYYGHNVKDLVNDAKSAFKIHFSIVLAISFYSALLVLFLFINKGANGYAIASLLLVAPLFFILMHTYRKKNKVLSDLENGTYKSAYKNNVYITNFHASDVKCCETEFNESKIVNSLTYAKKKEIKEINRTMTKPYNNYLISAIAAIALIVTTYWVIKEMGDEYLYKSYDSTIFLGLLCSSLMLYFAATPMSINNIVLQCIKSKGYFPKKYKLTINKDSILIPVNGIYPTNLGFLEIGFDAIKDIDYKDQGILSTLTLQLNDDRRFHIAFNKNILLDINNHLRNKLIVEKTLNTIE